MTKRVRKPPARQKNRFFYDHTPSAFTLFRHQNYDQAARFVILEMHQRLKQRFWQRDRDAVQRIVAAPGLDELLDLAPLAVGLGQDAWEARLQEFKPEEILPAIGAGLARARGQIKNEEERSRVYEALIGKLRWEGKAGARVLVECFAELDAYGKGLACVIFGLLEEKASADMIWDFYLQERARQGGEGAPGALWGLVDLKDERANQALVDLLTRGIWTYELFGWLSMRGGKEAIHPLMEAIMAGPEDVRIQPMMALISVAQRVGREAFVAEIQAKLSGDFTSVELQSLVEQIFSQPASLAEEHFETFYRGLSQDSVKDLLSSL